MLLRRSTRSIYGSSPIVTGEQRSTKDSKPSPLDRRHEESAKRPTRRAAGNIDQATPQADSGDVPPSSPTPKRRRISAQNHTICREIRTRSSVDTRSAAAYSVGDEHKAPPASAPQRVDPDAIDAPCEVTIDAQIAASTPNSSEPPSTCSEADREHRSSATGDTTLAKASAHLLSVEPRLGPLVNSRPCHMFSPAGLAEKVDPFRSLVTGILAQQVSGAATKAITNKFIKLFIEDNDFELRFPGPAQVAAVEVSRLRSAGVSQRKAEYILGLAERFQSGELSTSMLLHISDEEVMEKLSAVRGLGRWSVEMFMFFGLKRMDIFSTGDLGVQRGMAAFMGKDVSRLKAKGGGKWKYMSEKEMLDGSEKFKPYRSLFMWYMWQGQDVDVSTLERGGGPAGPQGSTA